MAEHRKVLRLCAPFTELSPDDCAIPERCQPRRCAGCGGTVHYDPKAAIPDLGPELIICLACFRDAADAAPGGVKAGQ